MARQPAAPAPKDPDDDGLPVVDGLAERFVAAAHRTAAEPPGGSVALRSAAAGYWNRRDLATDADQAVAAPGGPPLLLALLAAVDGDVLLPRPCAAWYPPLVRLAGHPALRVPIPAQCGGLPDPFALLEAVRRLRSEGRTPGALVLSVADDPTGTLAQPELLHEVCEAALDTGVLVVSDETWRDTLHDPQAVFLSPAEMWPADVVVLADLAGAFTPPGWPAAVARFPDTARGTRLRRRVLAGLAAARAVLTAPVAAAAGHALTEPDPVRVRAAASARTHAVVAAAVQRELTTAGALTRPPQAGRQLYADLDELREVLAGSGITGAEALEDHLVRRLGRPVWGGHRFGEGPDELRVRVSTAPLLGAPGEQRLGTLGAAEPLRLPHVADALADLATAFRELASG